MCSSSQMRWATRLDISTQSCTLTSFWGTKGITSVAPIRGCCPWCRRISMVSEAFLHSWKAASSMAAGDPIRVKTQRLWLPSDWTSKSVQPGTLSATSTSP